MIIHVDAAHKGIGFVIRHPGGAEEGHSFPLAETTTNKAEYKGLILALEYAINNFEVEDVLVFSDSELMVRQINGIYKVKDDEIKRLINNVDFLTGLIGTFEIVHVKRDKNKQADKLSKIGTGLVC